MNKNNYDKKRSLTGYLMVSPAMILMLIFVFYPLVNLVYLSFFNYNLIGTKEFVGLKNYKNTFFSLKQILFRLCVTLEFIH